MSQGLYFFVGREFLGAGSIDSPWEPCLAYLCPVCGEVWGRVMSDSSPREWRAVQRECAKHDNPELHFFRTPGSLVDETRHPLASLPDDVIQREAELMLIQCAHNPS